MPPSSAFIGGLREASEKARRCLPDIITMGMKMSEMDGYEAIELLNKEERLKSIPVIAITEASVGSDLKYSLLTIYC